jgi:cellulose synthase/poly-beta-1,6-N-acetylglucosamine synthase-like glycosyltransferase
MYWTILGIAVVLLLAYCLLILQYRQWFLRLPVFNPATTHPPQTKFSVIIPARNEAEGIRECLLTVLQQNYPAGLFEVIVINDHSTDETEAIIKQLQQQYSHLRLFNLAEHLEGKQINSYKKKAIELAIESSNGQWMVTTDADCKVSADWLQLFDSYICKNDPVFIAAPVMFSNDGSFLGIFQVLDFISLQAITAAAVYAGYHTMCNGANIAYRKDVFEEVGKFAGIDQIASGDDMLLMYKIKKQYPQRLGYLFCRGSIVTTAAMTDWKSFINQRIRWASKADKYDDKKIFWILALVYAVNALLLILLIYSFFIKPGLSNWLSLIIAKTLIELALMIPAAKFFQQEKALRWFLLMQPLHIVYTVTAGWLGKFGNYQWKGRTVR